MEYARKVVYNGNIVDVEDIVCPGTELAHLSVGNLKKRMNEFAKILNDYSTQFNIIKQNIEDEFEEIKSKIAKNATSYETIVTTRLNSEKTKYDALYNHATDLIATATNDFNDINTRYSEMDEELQLLKTAMAHNNEDIDNNTEIAATLADQIINLKSQFNKIFIWIAGLFKAAINEIPAENLKNLTTMAELKQYKNDELKYNDITNLTEEWNEYLSEYHPANNV